MKKPKSEFPLEVKDGSVIVKIYKVGNKARDRFTFSYDADGKRQLKMFADLDEAHAEAKSTARSLSKGELDVLHLGNAERLAERKDIAELLIKAGANRDQKDSAGKTALQYALETRRQEVADAIIESGYPLRPRVMGWRWRRAIALRRGCRS